MSAGWPRPRACGRRAPGLVIVPSLRSEYVFCTEMAGSASSTRKGRVSGSSTCSAGSGGSTGRSRRPATIPPTPVRQKRRRDGGRGMLDLDSKLAPSGRMWSIHGEPEGTISQTGSVNRRGMANFRASGMSSTPHPQNGGILTGEVLPRFADGTVNTHPYCIWQPDGVYAFAPELHINLRRIVPEPTPPVETVDDNLCELQNDWDGSYYSRITRRLADAPRRLARARDHNLGRFVQDRRRWLRERSTMPLRPLTPWESAYMARLRTEAGVTAFPRPTGTWARPTPYQQARAIHPNGRPSTRARKQANPKKNK